MAAGPEVFWDQGEQDEVDAAFVDEARVAQDAFTAQTGFEGDLL